MEQRSDLALYFSQDLIRAGRLTESEVVAVFESKSYDNWRKNRENRDKTMGALIKGVNNIIKGIGVLAKVFTGR